MITTLLITTLAPTYLLLPTAPKGYAVIYEYKATMAMGGQSVKIASRNKMVVEEFPKKGQVTFRFEGGEMSLERAGQTNTFPGSTSRATFKTNGEIVSFDPEVKSPEQLRSRYLLAMVVPSNRVSIGATWSWKSNGIAGTGKFVAVEQHLGLECAKLALHNRETDQGTPATAQMEVWYSLKDGLPVDTIVHAKDVPLAPGSAGTIEATNRRP